MFVALTPAVLRRRGQPDVVCVDDDVWTSGQIWTQFFLLLLFFLQLLFFLFLIWQRNPVANAFDNLAKINLNNFLVRTLNTTLESKRYSVL